MLNLVQKNEHQINANPETRADFLFMQNNTIITKIRQNSSELFRNYSEISLGWLTEIRFISFQRVIHLMWTGLYVLTVRYINHLCIALRLVSKCMFEKYLWGKDTPGCQKWRPLCFGAMGHAKVKHDYTQKSRTDCQTTVNSGGRQTGLELNRLQAEYKHRVSQVP